METKTRECRLCNVEIATARLKALPDTLVCVNCSEEIGDEYKLKVTVNSTAKPGSLKLTGQQVSVRRQRKPFH